MKFELFDTVAAVTAASASALAVITPSEEVRHLAFCTIGAVLGGFVGASISTEPTKGEADRRAEVAKRWAVNCSAGIFIGPVASEYLLSQFPDFSKLYVAIFSGGVCGVGAVAVLCLMMPVLLNAAKARLKSLAPDKKL